MRQQTGRYRAMHEHAALGVGKSTHSEMTPLHDMQNLPAGQAREQVWAAAKDKVNAKKRKNGRVDILLDADGKVGGTLSFIF